MTTDKRRAYNREVYLYPELLNKREKNEYVNTPEWKMWHNAKSRAKMTGREFTIEISDIVILSICPYLGIPLKMNTGNMQYNSPALDRIDNSKGYVPGNVEVISHRANMMKNDASFEELVQFANAVLDRWENEGGSVTSDAESEI